MSNISLIAAIGKNNELGKDNKLIWNIPGDLKFFKEITMNHTIVMGYHTYESIGKVLPNRKNIILTSKDIEIENAYVYHNIDDMLNSQLKDNEELFIIGGSSLYNYFYSLADKMYLTLIDDECVYADSYFPIINNSDWKIEILDENEENNIKYKHVLYRRKKK